MPFKSEAQRRYLWANEPEIARDWTDTYGSRIQKSNGGIMSMQGGVKNYLGEQPMVSAPKYWQSAPDHEMTELAYITPRERDVLVDMNMYGTMNGSPNKGPSGIMSLNGWGDANEGMADKSFGGNERPGRSSVNTGRTHHATDTPMKTSTRTVSPKDHITKSWTGPKTWWGGGGYKDLKVAGDPSQGHKSGIGSLLLGGLLSVINPALGMAYRGYKGLQGLTDKFGNKIGDWRENLTGYRTQKEWEDARKQRQLQNRFDKLMNRKLSGKNYSQKNLDMLSAMGINPSKDSLAAALAKDANQSMNMFDGPFSRTHLQSVAEGLPPQGPSGMYNLDDMLMDKAMGPYSSQPGPWNEMGAFKAPFQPQQFHPSQGNVFQNVDPSQQQFGGGITNTPQGQGFWGNLFSNFPRM